MPDILASCDVYCCTSWYEGLGLPALEAFCCGLPVVSTRTYGVSDYGLDDVNLLLAHPNNPQDLYEKLKRLLLDEPLAERLRQAGFVAITDAYDWKASVTQFCKILDGIDQTYRGPVTVDTQALTGMLDALEREGNLTPIFVFRQFEKLSAALEALSETMLAEVRPTPRSLKELESLRNDLRAYISNERAEYYEAFRAKYDLCQLLLSLKQDPRFVQYLALVMQRNNFERRPATTISEIQYQDRKRGPIVSIVNPRCNMK